MNRTQWLREAMLRHESRLLRYVSRLVGNTPVAGEVVQEAFLEMWRAGPQALEGRLIPWLFTVCRNRAVDALRKDSRMLHTDDDAVLERAAFQSAGAPAARLDLPTFGGDDELAGALASLSPRQMELVRLKFQEDLSYREIAEITGLTVNNVGVQIHAAIKTLRQKLGAKAGAK